MRIIQIDQDNDTEAWLHYRLGKVTGTKVKTIKPLSRGADRTPQGFWQILAEKICIKPDGEPDMDRGHRLQGDALKRFSEVYGLEVETNCGVWESDFDEDVMVSPDGCEKSSNPTWAVEVKCLASANHLKYTVKDLRARSSDTYQAIDLIPDNAQQSFREQIIQYFVVNENLETVYFVLYDDRVGIDSLVFHCIEIDREDVEGLVMAQKDMQINVLTEINKLIAELVEV